MHELQTILKHNWHLNSEKQVSISKIIKLSRHNNVYMYTCILVQNNAYVLRSKITPTFASILQTPYRCLGFVQLKKKRYTITIKKC